MPRPKKLATPQPKRHERQWHQGTVKEIRAGVWRAWRARAHKTDGTSTRPSKTFTGVDADARAKEWASGDPQSAVMYLGQHLESWLALRKPTIDDGTYRVYQAAVDACGDLLRSPIAEPTGDDWQRRTNDLLGIWSRYHVKVWRTIIGSAITSAIPRYLDTNPLAKVRLPRREEVPPKAWRQDEIDRLLAAAAKHHHEPWLVFSLGTGVRLGEARALLWDDVDLVNKVATIRASLDNKTNRRGPTKTRRIRIIDIPDEAVTMLAAHRKRQAAGTLLVFGKSRQTAYGSNTLRDFLRRCCKRAVVRELSPHSLRHSYASLALDDGVPIQDIAHQLGHSVKTCQETYAHWIGQGQRRGARALGKALRHRFSGPKRVPRAKIGTDDNG